MSKIIVLAGGTSDEREVSLRSGAAVVEALKNSGHTVKQLDPADGLENLLSDLQSADVIFPALHGLGGEDGTLQKFLEDHSINFVGSDSQASALCFDKARYTELLSSNDILVPQTQLVDYNAFNNSELRKQPFALKPNDGGSSIDTFIIRDVNQLNQAAIEQAFNQHSQLLLQELIVGDEITVAVLDNQSLPVIEIIPPQDQEFDYENKYNGATQELCPPVNIADHLQSQAQQLASQIHQLTGCRDMSRTDIMISGDEKLYVLETNTIPGLTPQSLLPKAAAAGGYTMEQLCDLLVNAALKRAA